MSPKGIIIAAPSSGAGKTTVTLGLIRALKNRGINVHPLKSGPDYIDPAFHAIAAGKPSYNIDAWSMSDDMIGTHIEYGHDADLIIAEGAMGLFDGGAKSHYGRTGAVAEISAMTGWPVILVMSVASQAQSAAAIAEGFSNFDPSVNIAGVILNQVASDRHENLIREAISARGIQILGSLRRNADLALPSRHLGLVQAQEVSDLDDVIENLATFIGEHVALDEIVALAKPSILQPRNPVLTPPPAQLIAIAQDAAFSFLYPHHIKAWQTQGAELIPFSPLADEAPSEDADFVWLPGGYPELYGGQLSAATRFKSGMRAFATSKPIHGECGGYMALGEVLIDKSGESHEMLGLLKLVTSFEKRKFNLGYRRADFHKPLYPSLSTSLHGHEFHYSSILKNDDEPLTKTFDASGTLLSQGGSRAGNITGTFFHMIGEIR